MCGNKHRRANEYVESYEGQTTQLHAEVGHHRFRAGWRAFPWWTLWLIWPLLGLLKSANSALLAGWLALGTFAVPLNLVLAIGLMIVGVALLVRQRAR